MAKRFTITQKNIGQFACPEGRKDMLYFVEGERGLALRVTASGNQSWFFQYVSPVSGHDRRIAIGNVDAVSVSAAKHRAQELRGKVASGHCPHFDHQEKLRKDPAPKHPTIAKAIEIHSERVRMHIKRPEEKLRALKRALEPFSNRPVKDISRNEWVGLFEGIAKTRPYAANRAQAATSAMLSDLYDQGLIEAHPLLRLRKRGKEVARDRVYSRSELASCWAFAISQDPSRTPVQFRHIVALLALTGCRRDEIASMRWNEIDFEKNNFVLPPERSKTKMGRSIPLCDQAIEILKSRPIFENGSYVFGDATGGRKPFSGFSKGWELFKSETNLSDDLRLHDLRRSFSTYADETLETPIAVIEAFLGHLSGARSGIVGVYNRADYNQRARILAQRYGEFLQSLSSSLKKAVA